MHIPDGYLGPATYGAMYAVMMPVWAFASWKLNRTMKASEAPTLALGAAFSFVVMLFNIPLPGGTTGHAVGATLIAVLAGPWAATIAVSVALIIQAFLFGDGGITAIGANCFNIAFAGSVVGYGIYRLAAGSAPGERRRTLAAGIGAYVSVNVSALLTAVLLGIQPIIERGADGRPLYAPFPLEMAVPAVALGHLVLFGFVEAAVTALVIRSVLRSEPEMIKG